MADNRRKKGQQRPQGRRDPNWKRARLIDLDPNEPYTFVPAFELYEATFWVQDKGNLKKAGTTSFYARPNDPELTGIAFRRAHGRQKTAVQVDIRRQAHKTPNKDVQGKGGSFTME